MANYTSDVINPAYDMAGQTVGYGAAAGTIATQYPATSAGCVWVMCTTTAYVFVGTNAAAATTSNGVPVAANVPAIIDVHQEIGTWTVSAIRIGGSDGTLYVKPLAN